MDGDFERINGEVDRMDGEVELELVLNSIEGNIPTQGLIDNLEALAFKCLKSESRQKHVTSVKRILQFLDIHSQTFCATFLESILHTPETLGLNASDPIFLLHLVCALREQLFQDNFEIINSAVFWKLIQIGLTHQCSLTRKRALFLMKRYTDTKSPTVNSYAQGILGDMDTKDWEEYFLILETLEEKQVHIVQQVMNKLPGLVRFHASWVFIVYCRFFTHQHITVVKWGLENFLSTFNVQAENFAGDIQDFLTTDLLQCLNDSKLYTKDGDVHYGQTICDLVTGYINQLVIKYRTEEVLIVGSFVQGISKVSWGPLPLYWISSVLPQIQCGKILTETSVLSLLDLVELHMVYQEPVLRGAAQHNLLSFVCQKLESIAKPVLETFLFTFWRNKIITVDTYSWNAFQIVLMNMYGNDANQIMEETLAELSNLKDSVLTDVHLLLKSVQKTLLPFLVMLSGSPSDLFTTIGMLYQSLFSNTFITNRPYAAERVNLNLEEASRFRIVFLKSLMELLSAPERRNGRNFLKYYESKPSSNHLSEMVSYLLQTNDNLESIFISLDILKLSQDVDNIGIADVYCDVLSIVPIDQSKAMDILEQNLKELINTKASSVARAISLKVCLAILKSSTNLTSIVIRSVLTSIPIQLTFDHSVSNRESQKISGEYMYEFTNNQMELIKLCIVSNPSVFTQEIRESIMNYLEQTLESCGSKCAEPAIGLANLLEISALSLINQTETVLLELRKNDMFWPVLQTSLDLIFSNMKYNPVEMLRILNTTARDSSAPGVMGSLILMLDKQFQKGLLHVDDHHLIYEGVIPILARGVVFGPTFRRDQMIVTDTNRIISEKGPLLSVNLVEGSDHELCQTVRIKSINILLSLIYQNPTSAKSIILDFLKSTADLQLEVSKGRIRHFENSEVHKLRNRMMQALLLVSSVVGAHPLIDEKFKVELLNVLLEQLLEHTEQTSVRYLTEWSAITLIKSSLDLSSRSNRIPSGLENSLWDWLEKASTLRIGAVPSFISVICGVCQHARLPDRPSYLEKALVEISPWSMAQQFGIRVVAQLSFRKIWECCSEFPEILQKYHVLNQCLSRSLQASDKSTKNLTEDFYLARFDPVEHFTLPDIFLHFPNLCGLGDEEKISRNVLTLLKTDAIQGLVGSGDESSTLENCSPTKLVPRETSVIHPSTDNIQRKITPWKSMSVEADSDESQRFSKSKAREYPDLIVIASLIDRMPNLGGLCRTCEIFGVGKMTIPSSAALKDKDFTGISVTAEQWIPLEEVSEPNLPEYLTTLKKEGWAVVAIEQASRSVPLNRFKFPQKCAILLGKEREGVPVELLNLVDDCIEVPQHGLIRSFNVHVTGAIVLWEYVRQHL